jgi:hypothetical protein
VGVMIGGLSTLMMSPASRRFVKQKLQDWRDDSSGFFETTRESTEDLIERTKQSIESGFDRLGDIIKENQRVNAFDEKPMGSAKK